MYKYPLDPKALLGTVPKGKYCPPYNPQLMKFDLVDQILEQSETPTNGTAERHRIPKFGPFAKPYTGCNP